MSCHECTLVIANSINWTIAMLSLLAHSSEREETLVGRVSCGQGRRWARG